MNENYLNDHFDGSLRMHKLTIIYQDIQLFGIYSEAKPLIAWIERSISLLYHFWTELHSENDIL